MNPSSIEAKKQNIVRIARAIYDHPQISRKELGHQFGLSASTVTLAVNALLEQQLLTECGQEPSAAGRKAQLLQVRPDAGRFLILQPNNDHSVHLQLCDLCGSRLAERHSEPPIQLPTRETYSQLLTHAAQEFLDELNCPALTAAAVIIPGVMNQDGTADLPVFGWNRVSFSHLQKALQIPVYCDTILHLLGGYEVQQAGPAGMQIYLSLEPGVGMSCYRDGQAITSRNLLFGEVGHISMHEDGPPCYCGNRGCLEYYCGVPGILSRMAALAPHCPILSQAPLTLEALDQAAQDGSIPAQQLLAQVATELGRAIVTIRNMLDPDQIIISGRLWQMDAVRNPASALVYSRTLSGTRAPLPLLPSALPSEHYEIGVCHNLFNRTIEHLFD